MGAQVLDYASLRIDEFAKQQAAKSWCIDISGGRPLALHASANRTASLDSFAFDYLEWAPQQGIKIPSEAMGELSRTIPMRIGQALPRVAGSAFRPVDEPFIHLDGVSLANTYRAYRPTPLKAEEFAEGFKLLKEYLERTFPDPDERRVVIQYLAHLIQKPLSRPQYGLLITGAGGTGKSLLARCVERALGGRHYWRENDYNAAFKPFSEVFPEHLIVTFDDAPPKPTTYEQLKHAITRSEQEVELKGVQRRVRKEVYCRIVILSNERKPFDLSGDRRFFVPRYCVHRVSKDESNQFFERFVPWVDSAASGPTLYHWLVSQDLEGFSEAAPPITETHRQMGLGADHLEDVVRTHVQDGQAVHTKEIIALMRQMGAEAPSATEIGGALKKIGYVERRRSHPSRPGQISMWVPADRRRNQPLTPAQIDNLRAVGALC